MMPHADDCDCGHDHSLYAPSEPSVAPVLYTPDRWLNDVYGMTVVRPESTVNYLTNRDRVLANGYAVDRDRWPLTDDPEAVASHYGQWALLIAAALAAYAFLPLLYDLTVRLWWIAR